MVRYFLYDYFIPIYIYPKYILFNFNFMFLLVFTYHIHVHIDMANKPKIMFYYLFKYQVEK